MIPDLASVLRAGVQLGASDIILAAGRPPVVRVNGQVRPLENIPPLSSDDCKALVYSGLYENLRARFEQDWELDYSFTIPNVSRFRANVLVQRGGVAAVYRVIPAHIPAPAEIGLTREMTAVTDLHNGLVIITGPTGSGKSTTLAALIDQINAKYRKSIITIEDPVEFVYEARNSVILQREVGQHTKSFREALRRALRQAPDVIMIGEMRDLETIQLAITAAETGHLCFGTLHTQDCASTIDRIIDVFPPGQQEQVRTQLSLTLQAVIAQILLPSADGRGRVAAREFMVSTPAISSLIRDKKAHMIYSALETGKKFGMMTMDQNLAALVTQGRVRTEDAQLKAQSPEMLRRLITMFNSPRPI
ncbi:MAG: type IV pilus twitching motility protein PilT [Elusimicrobiales bacterium]|nr:type IV pilus twitching motility protein PilT [Elusimicrobiales bacterium]